MKATKKIIQDTTWIPKFDGDWILFFRKCARRIGIHPRAVLDVPNVMSNAGISQKQWKTLTEEVIQEAVKAAYKSAQKWAEEHNTNGGNGYVSIKEYDWLNFMKPEERPSPKPKAEPETSPAPATDKRRISTEKPSPAKPVKPAPEKKRGRRYVFGESMTSMLHWMGANGVSPDVAYGVVTSQPGCEDVPMAVVKAHLGVGTREGFDEELSADLLSKLRKACGTDKSKKKSTKR